MWRRVEPLATSRSSLSYLSYWIQILKDTDAPRLVACLKACTALRHSLTTLEDCEASEDSSCFNSSRAAASALRSAASDARCCHRASLSAYKPRLFVIKVSSRQHLQQAFIISPTGTIEGCSHFEPLKHFIDRSTSRLESFSSKSQTPPEFQKGGISNQESQTSQYQTLETPLCEP